MEEHALPRPRRVVDADGNPVGRLAEVDTDDDGRVKQLVLDLSPEASEALFGRGMKHGVVTLAPDEVRADGDGVRLAKNLADLRLGWKKRTDEEDP